MNFNTSLLKQGIMLDLRSRLVLVIRILLVGLFLYQLYQLLDSNLTASGLAFFRSITRINLFFSIAGIALFASAVTEEKEVNSLGLLLMTGIEPLELLFSKMLSKFFIGCLFILVQIPFALLAITLGGVSLTQIIAVYLCVICFTFMVCNISLFTSVCFRMTGTAALAAVIIVLLFILMLDDIAMISPYVRIEEILSTGYNDKLFSWELLTNSIIGLSFFAGARLMFNRCCRQQSHDTPRSMLEFNSKLKFKPLAAKRAWRLALCWKDFYFLSSGKVGIALRCLLLVLGAIIAIVCKGRLTLYGVVDFLQTAACWLIVLDSIGYFGRVIRKEMDWQTISSLGMLPISPRNLLFSKLLGVFPVLTPGIIVLACAVCMELYIKGFELNMLAGLCIIGFFLLAYLLMTLYLSMYIKYGAFVIAFFLNYILFFIIAVPVFLSFFIIEKITFGDETAAIVILSCLGLTVGCGVLYLLYRLIISKLKKVIST